MNDIPSQTIEVLTFLLPGFVTAALRYRLTPRPKPIPFERVVQALVYTVFIQGFVFIVQWLLLFFGDHWRTFGPWTDTAKLVWSFVMAFPLGFLIASLDNNDLAQSVLRKLRITYQTSYPNEWFGTLRNQTGYLVLHLNGDRRLFGWAVEWPNQPDQGHFVMAEAEWLLDKPDSQGRTTIPLTGVRRMLIRATDVEMVELMEPVPPNNGGRTGESDGRQQATESTTA
jgi:hypothetical protein